MNKIIPLLFLFLLLIARVSNGQSTALLQGSLYDEFQNPVENASVLVIGTDYRTFSDGLGFFSMSIPAGKEIEIYFQHLSFKDTIIRLTAQQNEKIQLKIVLFVKGELLKPLDVIARHDDGYVRIDPKLNFKIPTPTGGVESLIKMLSGVSSTNELSSQYNVRGGNYDENLVYVNDIEIHRPFLVRSAQQEGMSFVNLDLTNSVKFSAGAFEAKYGDKMSSVLDVEYRKPTRYAGSFSASLLGVTAHAEGNVKDKFTFLVGARYKTNAYLLNSLESKGDYKPNFFDTQMLLVWNPVKKLEISLLGNFSNNSYIYIPTDRESNIGTVNSSMRIKVFFEGQEVDKYENYLGGLTFAYKPNQKNNLRLILSSYYARESETYDILSEYFIRETQLDLGSGNEETVTEGKILGVGSYLDHARNYITAVVSTADLRGDHKMYRNLLSWGIKMQSEIIQDQIKEWSMIDSSGYTIPTIFTTPNDSLPVSFDDPSRLLIFGENNFLKSSNDLNTIRFSGFIQDQWNIDGDSATRFRINAGVRFSYWSYNNEIVFSPRINFMYKPRWKSDWVFFLKTGIYYQPPFYREMRNKEGELNQDIKSQRSYQVVVAAEYNFQMWRRPFRFTAEAYYKYMDRLISYTVDNVKIIYSGANDAVGYATGIDLKLSGEFIHGLESWVSISLMKTAEDILTDYNEEKQIEPGYMPRPTDQRFAINVFFQDHIPGLPPLRVQLNFVFSSGIPYCPPNIDRYKYSYEENGKIHYPRTPWYKRVDIGFSYMFLEQGRDRMKHKSKATRAIRNLGLYFEVFNLLNIKNEASYSWLSMTDGSLVKVPNYLTGRLFNVKFAIDF